MLYQHSKINERTPPLRQVMGSLQGRYDEKSTTTKKGEQLNGITTKGVIYGNWRGCHALFYH